MNPENETSSEAQQDFFETLRWLAVPVVVVGSAVDSESHCATGTLSYVSLQPPMIATSLAREGRTYQLAHESRLLSISLLRGDQVEVAVMAARHGSAANKFDELNFGVQQWSDVPALRDCGAVMWCSLEQEHSVGDAVLCVGEVQWVTSGSRDAGPLLRFGGRYHAMGDLLEVADELPYPL